MRTHILASIDIESLQVQTTPALLPGLTSEHYISAYLAEEGYLRSHLANPAVFRRFSVDTSLCV